MKRDDETVAGSAVPSPLFAATIKQSSSRLRLPPIEHRNCGLSCARSSVIASLLGYMFLFYFYLPLILSQITSNLRRNLLPPPSFFFFPLFPLHFGADSLERRRRRRRRRIARAKISSLPFPPSWIILQAKPILLSATSKSRMRRRAPPQPDGISAIRLKLRYLTENKIVRKERESCGKSRQSWALDWAVPLNGLNSPQGYSGPLRTPPPPSLNNLPLAFHFSIKKQVCTLQENLRARRAGRRRRRSEGEENPSSFSLLFPSRSE